MNKPKAFSIVHNLLIDVEFVEMLDVVVISERFFYVFYLFINSSFVHTLAPLSRFLSLSSLVLSLATKIRDYIYTNQFWYAIKTNTPALLINVKKSMCIALYMRHNHAPFVLTNKT